MTAVAYEAADRVARVTLNRPERGNGITPALVTELEQAVGRTTCSRTINFPGNADRVGRYLNVRVTGAGPNSLTGILSE